MSPVRTLPCCRIVCAAFVVGFLSLVSDHEGMYICHIISFTFCTESCFRPRRIYLVPVPLCSSVLKPLPAAGFHDVHIHRMCGTSHALPIFRLRALAPRNAKAVTISLASPILECRKPPFHNNGCYHFPPNQFTKTIYPVWNISQAVQNWRKDVYWLK